MGDICVCGKVEFATKLFIQLNISLMSFCAGIKFTPSFVRLAAGTFRALSRLRVKAIALEKLLLTLLIFVVDFVVGDVSDVSDNRCFGVVCEL